MCFYVSIITLVMAKIVSFPRCMHAPAMFVKHMFLLCNLCLFNKRDYTSFCLKFVIWENLFLVDNPNQTVIVFSVYIYTEKGLQDDPEEFNSIFLD
jgi:hypothetical protein